MSQIDENKIYELRGPFKSKLKDMVITDSGNKNEWEFITFSRKSIHDKKSLDSYTCSKDSINKIDVKDKINIIELKTPLLGTIRITPEDQRYIRYSKKIDEVKRQ